MQGEQAVAAEISRAMHEWFSLQTQVVHLAIPHYTVKPSPGCLEFSSGHLALAALLTEHKMQ
jgi:hypothetical protein